VSDLIEIELPGGRAVFTTRAAGNLATEEARDALGERLGVRVARGRQVHGAHVRRVTEPPDGTIEEADGHATALPGVAPMVVTADCLPIALIAPEAVAMLHAGWRGIAAGVIEEGVHAMRELGATEMAAAIGPGAGPCCYEAGPEVHEALVASVGRNVDLKLAARRRLQAAGVGQIHDVGLCTICDERFFSHRREQGRAGRQAGVAWRS
jgi:purine-nucleoside/S-methyl-5'-thioadenosine phosphorylase / adenosine deaminase